MKALVWKELRENIGWALLALLALGGSEFFALLHTQYPGQLDVYYGNGITLCKKTFLMVTTFGCPVTGLALGFLQLLPELKRDRWAALLHRPVSRGRFFWGKAAAGVLLYFLAAGGPFLAAVGWVATPGHFPSPFVPAMIRPGLADLATGLAYYFAALLVALQGGRIPWRVLPLFAAIHVSFAVVNEDRFWDAASAAFAMTLALCVAGWGAIHVRETWHGRPWLGRIAFLIVAFYGACGLGDAAQWLGRMAGFRGDRKFSVWEVLDNGVPARIDYVNSVVVAVTDVAGQPFADPKYRPDRVRSFTLGMNTSGSYVGDSHGWQRKSYERDYRESYTYLYGLQPYEYPRFEQWFHLHDPEIFVGMLPLEKREFARFGADGFAPAGASVRGFPQEVRYSQVDTDTLVLAAEDALRLVRLSNQTWSPIPLPAPGPVYGMCHSWAQNANKTNNFEGVALATSFPVVDARGAIPVTLPYHHDVDRWGRLSLGVLKSLDRFVLEYQPSDWIEWNTRKTLPWYVDVMDIQGQVVASYELPPAPPHVNPPKWSTFIAQRMKTPAFFFGEMLYQRLGAAFGSSRLRDSYRAHFGQNARTTFEIGRSVVLIALLCAALTFTWARRALLSTRRAGAWAAAVLALGLPGLVVFWLVGHRPLAVTCPACRQFRRIEDDRCHHCGAAWPEHPADDTAILEQTPAAPVAA